MKKSFAGFFKSIIIVMSLLIVVVGICGCKKKEAPIEKTGKAMDRGIEATKDAMNDVAKEVEKNTKE